jgi:hypothetical protein
MAASQEVVSFGGGPIPKILPRNVARQMAERVKLYIAVPPPGWMLPINATQIAVPDGLPMDLEIREVVVKLWNGRAAGAIGMKAEHLKGWLRDVKCEDAVDDKEGAGNH